MLMRSLSISRPGGPDFLEKIEIPRPAPRSGTVLVRNHAVGVNFVETLIRRGKLPPTLVPTFPFIPGQEGAGIVVALGDDVKGLAVGMRVMWMDDPFEAHGYAEYSVVRANNAVPIADNVSFEMAAAVPVVHATARNQIYNLYGRAEGAGRWALARNAAGGAGTPPGGNAAPGGVKGIPGWGTPKPPVPPPPGVGGNH